MPKTVNTALLEDDVPVTPPAAANTSKLVVAFLALQTILLITILAGGTYAYGQISDRADQIDAVINVMNNPQDILSNPALVKASVKFLRDTSSAFFLGSSNGTLTAFVENTLMYDFAELGEKVQGFSATIYNAFAAKASADPNCFQSVTCSESNTNVQCSNGNWYWCEYQGQQYQCGGCTYAGIATAASIVESVAIRVAALPAMSENPNGPATNPALSDGLFRLDDIIGWVMAQANSTAWKGAGKRCVEFANHVGDINWAGNYTDNNGQQQNWDYNGQVQPIVSDFIKYCGVFANMNVEALNLKP